MPYCRVAVSSRHFVVNLDAHSKQGDILELQTLIASLREVIKAQADELQSVKSRLAQSQSQPAVKVLSAEEQKKADELFFESAGEVSFTRLDISWFSHASDVE